MLSNRRGQRVVSKWERQFHIFVDHFLEPGKYRCWERQLCDTRDPAPMHRLRDYDRDPNGGNPSRKYTLLRTQFGEHVDNRPNHYIGTRIRFHGRNAG